METLQEQTWFDRRPNAQHYQWFENLVDLHRLTHGWLKDLRINHEDSNQLRRVLSPGVQDKLAILDHLTEESLPSELETLLDDSHPDELLERLEQTVWVVQAWTLRGIVEKTARAERGALKNSLQQTSWKLGRDCAQRRWKGLPESSRIELQSILAAVQDSPLSGYPHRRPYLIQRAVKSELQLELLNCPHTVTHVEAHPVSGDLCELHADFLRGFVYYINPAILLEHHLRNDDSEAPGTKNERCRQKWTYLEISQ